MQLPWKEKKKNEPGRKAKLFTSVGRFAPRVYIAKTDPDLKAVCKINYTLSKLRFRPCRNLIAPRSCTGSSPTRSDICFHSPCVRNPRFPPPPARTLFFLKPHGRSLSLCTSQHSCTAYSSAETHSSSFACVSVLRARALIMSYFIPYICSAFNLL